MFIFSLFDAFYSELHFDLFSITAFFAFACASVVVLLILSILDHFKCVFC